MTLKSHYLFFKSTPMISKILNCNVCSQQQTFQIWQRYIPACKLRVKDKQRQTYIPSI